MPQKQINTTDPGSDRIVDAFGKSNDNATDSEARLTGAEGHAASTANPHGVTASQAGALTQAEANALYKAIGYIPAWAEITGKPTVFPPEAHGHADATTSASGFASAADKTKLGRALDVETSQRIVYVSPTGSDTAGDGTSASRWATIQHAINQARIFMQPRNGVSNYKIVCATGTYSERPVISQNLLSGFRFEGLGGIWIISETGIAADVIIANTDAESGVSVFGSCSLEKVTIQSPTRGVLVRGHPSVYATIRDSVLQIPSGNASAGNAIEVQIGRAFSNNNSSPTGQQFSYGLNANVGGVIGKVSGQPVGAVANEAASSGGVVR